MENKIAYVVPTKDRPDELRVLFSSLRAQTRMYDQLIVVDGSDPDIKYVCDEYSDLDITYVREFPPSLARQRNVGMAALHKDITIAGYLDDDLELDPIATERMVAFWEHADDTVGGAAMSINNQLSSRHMALMNFFLMDGEPPGMVLPSSFQCAIPTINATCETKWLYGGATMWRREVIEEFSYDEWYAGHGYGEDFDYSYRVGKKYRMFVVNDSRTEHHHHPMSLTQMYSLGRQQTYNRIYFVRKYKGDFPLIKVAWAMFGLMSLNALAVVRHPGKPTLDRLRGNVLGLFSGLLSTRASFLGYWKD